MKSCTTIKEAKRRLAKLLNPATIEQDDSKKIEIIKSTIKTIKLDSDPSFYEELAEYAKVQCGKIGLDKYANDIKLLFSSNINMDSLFKSIEERTKNAAAYQESILRKSQVKRSFLQGFFYQNSLAAENFLRTAEKGSSFSTLSITGNYITVPGFVDTFLANRELGSLVTKLDIRNNVIYLKLKLFAKVLDLMTDSSFFAKGKELHFDEIPLLFDNQGEYLKLLDPATEWQDNNGVLVLPFIKRYFENLLQGNNKLNELYLDSFKTGTVGKNALKVLEAYNAWVLLNNFDTVLSLTMKDTVIITDPTLFNKISNLSYSTNIDKATNMWGNGFGDDVENVADLISNVTQQLVEASRMYSWQSSSPKRGEYLSFKDFNYIIGKVKLLAFSSELRNIKIDLKKQKRDIRGRLIDSYAKCSDTTKKVILDIEKFNKQKLYSDPTPTLSQVIALISENPTRYFHTIFDLLCNTDILKNNKLGFNDNDKSLLWSLNLEIFGNNNRALFKLHHNTKNDTIFSIVTLIADSIFYEDIILYYEDEQGNMFSLTLLDYSVKQLVDNIVSLIQQSNVSDFYNPKHCNVILNMKNGEDYIIYSPQKTIYSDDKNTTPYMIGKIPVQGKVIEKIEIPLNVGNKELFKLSILSNGVTLKSGKDNTNTGAEARQLWESDEFLSLIQDALGVDFKSNPDFKNAYENTFYNGSIDYISLINDISKVVGTAIFNAEVNTFIVPTIACTIQEISEKEKIPKISLNPTNLEYIINALYMSGYEPDIQQSTGQLQIIPSKSKVNILSKLSQAKAVEYKVFSAAQVKTGEGTSLAQYTLSRLRNSYAYLLATLNELPDSSTRDMTFVLNKNGFFGKVFTSRELKSKKDVKQTTKMNGTELWSFNFFNGFVSAFCKKHRPTSPVGNGWATFIPTVNSDKGQYDNLPVNLKALSHIKGENGRNKLYEELNSQEIEQEIKYEFGPFFRKTIKNINTELNRVLELLNLKVDGNPSDYNPLTYWVEALNTIQEHYGPKYSDAVDGLYRDITLYNATHSRNPIQLGELIHYVKGSNGKLSINRVLAALFLRFSANETEKLSFDIDSLYYKKDTIHRAVGILSNYYTAQFHKYEDIINSIGLEYIEHYDAYSSGEEALLTYGLEKSLVLSFADNPLFVSNYTVAKDNLGNASAATLIAAEVTRLNRNINDEDLTNWEAVAGQGIENFLNDPSFKLNVVDNINGLINEYFLSKNQQVPSIITDNPFSLDNFNYPIFPLYEKVEYYNHLDDATIDDIKEDIKILQKQLRDEKGNEIPENVEVYNGVSKAILDLQAATIEGYFNKVDYEAAIKLIKLNCEIYLEGNYAREQEETEYLKEFEDFITEDGKMAFFKVFKGYDNNGVAMYEATNNLFTVDDTLRSGNAVEIHPLIKKYNRLDFLASQLYAYCVGGATFVYKGKGDSVIDEESSRWNASNKRNNAYTATIHKYENSLLTGAPRFLNYAIFEDIVTPLYNPMGLLNSHTPLDGCTIIDPFITILENNSLGGEAAGTDKKNYAVIYMEKYGVTATEKTASFAVTNERMRESLWWRNVGENMCARPWVKEYADSLGNDIKEVLDITKDFNGENIDWGGRNIFYYDEVLDEYSRSIVHFYKTVDVISKGNNEYEILRKEVDKYGNEIEDAPSKTITIDNNWTLFTEVFGGYKSLYYPTDLAGNEDTNAPLIPSERSRYLMVDAMNQVGYFRDDSHKYDGIDEKGNQIVAYEGQKINLDEEYEYDQEDVWQPLKYSNVLHFNNIGAIKSAQCNVNPSNSLYEKMPLNTTRVKNSQSGILLDKEHEADDAELSMPTLIITACANKGYVLDKATDLYKALSTLTEIAIEDCMDGVMDIMPEGENKGILLTKIAEIIIDKLIHGSSDNEALASALDFLIDKRKKGEKLSPEDVKGKVAWSDSTIYNKIYSDLASSLTSSAIKLKISGSLAVICPSHGFEQLIGNKRLTTLIDLIPGGLGIESAILEYQAQLKNSSKLEECVYNEAKDGKLSNNEKLSNLSHILTQHNYHVEYIHPITGLRYRKTVTINYPQLYYLLKQEVTKFTEVPSESIPNALAYTSSNGEIIVPKNVDVSYFLEYILGKATLDGEPLVASIQKLRVFEKLFEEEPLYKELVNTVLTDENGNYDSRKVRAFLLFHELSHKLHDDYKDYPKNLMDDSAINREVRATKEALNKMYEIHTRGSNALTYIDEIAIPSVIYEAVCEYETLEDGSRKVKVLSRELSAYNVQFKSEAIENNDGSIEQQEFCLYDLDSIKSLFEVVNDVIPDGPDTTSIKEFGKNQFKDINSAEKYVDSLPFYTKASDKLRLRELVYLELLKEGKEVALLIRADYNALTLAKESLKKDPNNDEILQEMYRLLEKLDLTLHEITNTNIMEEAGKAYQKVLEKDLRIRLQKDLLKLSSDYQGIRTVFCNGKEVTVDSDSIVPIAYEVIMPKIFKTVFGLLENDDCLKIAEDKFFFAKRGITKIKTTINDIYYDYVLRNFSGNHTYIMDTTSEKEIPKDMIESPNFWKITELDGKIYRVDINGEIMYLMSSINDKIMLSPTGVEIIVTEHPEFYIKNIPFNAFTFSNIRVSKELLSNLANIIDSDPAKDNNKVYNVLFNRKGELKSFKFLKERNKDFNNLHFGGEPKNQNVSDILDDLILEGLEIHNSFLKSLDTIAGRIPAQSLQSFMGQKVVAFTSSDINSAYVSTFQLFIQGSDLDIDTVNLIAASISKGGKYVLWSPYANLLSLETIKESEQLPFPTGKSTEINIQENNLEGKSLSFFEVYDKYFSYDPNAPLTSLFIVKRDSRTGNIITDKNGVPQITINISNPRSLRLLRSFLNDVALYGITLTGNVNNRGEWLLSENLYSEIYANKDSIKPNNFKLFTELGIKPIHVYAIALLLKDIVDRHNLYIKQANPKTRELMAKNLCYTKMFLIIMDPSNQTEAQESLDATTKVIKGKGGAVEVSMTQDDKYGITVNNEKILNCDPVSKCFALRNNQVGKQGVAIGAKGVLAVSMVLYAYNRLLNNPSTAHLVKLPLLKSGLRGYKIAGKWRRLISGLYDKAQETNGLSSLDLEIQNELAKAQEEIFNSITLAAAMLSVAVDNAKDLCLGKMNATEEFFGMYVYGIMMGVDVPSLAKIINSTAGRAMTYAVLGNSFSGILGRKTAISAINFLKCLGIMKDLTLFDTKYGMQALSLLFYRAVLDVASHNIKNLDLKNYDRNDVTKFPKLLLLLYNVSKKGDSILSNIILFAIKYRNNVKDSRYVPDVSERQLHSWLLKFCKYSMDFKTDSINSWDLLTLAEGASEIKILGMFLGSNKGVKTKMDEGKQFIESFENLIISRLLDKGTPNIDRAANKINYAKFFTDSQYLQEVINSYEKIKHTINIPLVVSLCPHIFSYMRANMIPHIGFMDASSKYRSTLYALGQPAYINLEIFNKLDKASSLKKINKEINAHMLMTYLAQTLKTFVLPKDCKYYDKEGNIKTATLDIVVDLYTVQGLATFKMYMEEYIIPLYLKKDLMLKSNKFIKDLSLITYGNTITYNTVFAYSLPVNMIPKRGSAEETKLLDYKAAFKALSAVKFPNTRTELPPGQSEIKNMLDAFYIYTEYVYALKSPQSLMSLFEDNSCGILKEFREYKALFDSSRDFRLSPDELLATAALPSSTFSPKFSYFYSKNNNGFGNVPYSKVSEKMSPEEREAIMDIDPEAMPKNRKVKAIQQTDPLYSQDMKRHLLYPINPMETWRHSTLKIPLCNSAFTVKYNGNKFTEITITTYPEKYTKGWGKRKFEKEVGKIMNELNNNIDLCSRSVYTDGKVIIKVKNLDIVEAALNMMLKKVKGEC